MKADSSLHRVFQAGQKPLIPQPHRNTAFRSLEAAWEKLGWGLMSLAETKRIASLEALRGDSPMLTQLRAQQRTKDDIWHEEILGKHLLL
jgi:hypothetical protein